MLARRFKRFSQITGALLHAGSGGLVQLQHAIPEAAEQPRMGEGRKQKKENDTPRNKAVHAMLLLPILARWPPHPALRLLLIRISRPN